MIHLGMIKRFIAIWVIYWLVYFIQPVYSIYPNVIQAFILQLSFVVITCLFFFISSSGGARTPANINISFRFDNAVFIVRCGIILSIIGLLFLLYDKIVIQQIDYSQGLAAARQEWRVLGEERDSTSSSIFSAIGYLLGGTYFISLSIVLSRLLVLPDKSRFIYLMICAVLIFVNSAITGGRSSILLAIIFGSFGYFTKNGNISQSKLFQNKSLMKYFKIIIFLGGIYSVFIFYERAQAGDQLVGAYGIAFLGYLGLAPNDWFTHVAYETEWGAGASLLNLAVSYLTHSFATTAVIVESANGYGDVLFVNFMQIGAKFGLTSQPTDWFLGGRFSSFPGALYFQYGLMGLVVGSVLLGIIAGTLSRAFAANPTKISLFFSCSIFELILLMSPFLFAGEFLFFPSVVIGGLLTIFLSKLRSV